MAAIVSFVGWCARPGHGVGPVQGCPSCLFKSTAVKLCRDQFRATATYADMRRVQVYKRNIADNSREFVAKLHTTVESFNHSFGIPMAAYQVYGGVWFTQILAAPPPDVNRRRARPGLLPCVTIEMIGPLESSHEFVVPTQ